MSHCAWDPDGQEEGIWSVFDREDMRCASGSGETRALPIQIGHTSIGLDVE